MNHNALYNYFRSSTSYRVRIALRLKGLDFEYIPIHLRKHDQDSPEYRKLNAQGLVPTLVLEGEEPLTQSLAIIEYLDERFPEPRLLPDDIAGRMAVRRLAQMIAVDIHPINNLRVLRYIRKHFGADDAATAVWFGHWVREGFAPLEASLTATAGRFCYGDTVSMADLCLVPQVANSERFAVDMSPYPNIMRIYENCMEIPAFAESAPERQIDAE